MLARALVVANGKGGVGKSSLVAGLSTAAASGGWKVLVVDLDPHGAVDLDLGYRQSGLTDEGESLFRAVVNGSPLQPLEGVRHNLDVIAGGGYTEALVDLMADRLRRGDPTAVQAVDGRLAEVAPRYDLVVLDTPPSSTVALDAALCCGRAVLVPCGFDPGSLDGLEHVSNRYHAVRNAGLNTELELLGVAMFGFGPGEKRLRREMKADLEYELDGQAPVFETYIREARKAARHVRMNGLVASEYLVAAKSARPWYEDPAQERFAVNAEGFAQDYQDLSGEVLDRFRSLVAVEAPAGASW